MEKIQSMQQQPAAPAVDTGLEAQPLYEFKTLLTAEGLSEFYRAHLARHHRTGMRIVAAVGFLLIALAAVEYFLLKGTQGYIFELGCGLGFVALSFLLGPLITRSAVRSWKGPTKARYRLFEDNFEAMSGDGLEIKPYADILEILVSRGVVYLYVAKNRAFVLTREALAGRLEEVTAFLERRTGKRAARVGGKNPA